MDISPSFFDNAGQKHVPIYMQQLHCPAGKVEKAGSKLIFQFLKILSILLVHVITKQ